MDLLKFQLQQDIIRCSTCCLFGPVRATWVCASFNSIKSASVAVLSVSLDRLGRSPAAYDDLYRGGTCADPCGPDRFDESASTSADDEQDRVEACTNPCGPDRSNEAANTAADDDLTVYSCIQSIKCRHNYHGKSSSFVLFLQYRESLLERIKIWNGQSLKVIIPNHYFPKYFQRRTT